MFFVLHSCCVDLTGIFGVELEIKVFYHKIFMMYLKFRYCAFEKYTINKGKDQR